MNLYLRLIYTIVVSWWQGRATLQEEQRLMFRTWPHDLDLNLHMNNGRYLTLMDLGRMQLMARFGLFGSIFTKGWMPVIGFVHMRFRRSLSPFQAFTLSTRLVAWDEKWFYIEQKFYAGEELMAVGLVKGLIRAKTGNLPVTDLLALIGEKNAVSGPVPEVFREQRLG